MRRRLILSVLALMLVVLGAPSVFAKHRVTARCVVAQQQTAQPTTPATDAEEEEEEDDDEPDCD